MNTKQKKAFLTTLTIVCLLGFFSATVTADQAANNVRLEVQYDNELNSRMPDNVRSSSIYPHIGVSNLYGNETARYIAKVDTSTLDSSREIESAIFKIDRVSSTWDRDNNYYLCQVDEPWNTNSVTWNNQPSFSGTGSEGAYTSYGIFEFDFTNLVQNWISNPDSNNGFLIMKTYEQEAMNKLNESEANRGSFVSMDYPIAGGETRPYLEITYAALEPISDLEARAKNTKVSLVWTLPENAVSTNVYRDSGEGEFVLLVNTLSTYATYLDLNVPSGDHTYMVRWLSESGEESPDSNLAQVTIGGTPPPIFSWIEPYNIYTTFDLGENTTVGGVRATVYPDTVEISTDGIHWKTTSSYTVLQQEDFVEILFNEPTSAQYIRVYETRPYPSVYVGTAILGDFDGDGQVCRTDLDILLQHRDQPANEFPEGDLDSDGMITGLDARKLVLLCTNPRCTCN